MAAAAPRFGTFAGVYRPVFLTILGAMFYLRQGWLVGETGLLGALAVILGAHLITGTTALSLSSIASNLRVRPGGAFAIIAQALGLEAGAAIGVPLFIAQTASAAMYLYGFSEGWALLFPSHPPQAVVGVAFVLLSFVAWRSAGLAARAQGLLFGVIAVAIGSAALGLARPEPLVAPTWIGAFEGASLVEAFAIFFPAATGIMVGVGMSGSLADPRRSVPRGTLLAWGTTFAIYTAFAVWYAVVAPVPELIADKTAMIRHALVPELVLLGLLCSTLMASLSSLVAAPRLLQAMAAHGVLPGARWLARTTAGGDPRPAVLITTALASLGLAAGSLDAIAPLITSFFIMTYLVINAVVAMEQGLGMISFRPAFRVHRLVPLVGVGACLLGLGLASPFGGLFELFVVLAVYGLVSRRKIDTPWETVRSGVAVTVAAWAARRAAHIDRSERAWKPDLLVPVATAGQIDDMAPLVDDLIRRTGSVRWLGLGPRAELDAALPAVVARQAAAGHHAAQTRLRTTAYMDGLGAALDTLRAALFPPNLVLVDVRKVSDDEIAVYQRHCAFHGVGLGLWLPGPAGAPARGAVAVWISDRSPTWALHLHQANLDLLVLTGFLLAQARGHRLRLCTVVTDPEQKEPARAFLNALVDQARLPAGTSVHVAEGRFAELLAEAPPADLHLFGLGPAAPRAGLEQTCAALDAGALWLRDSGHESALA